MCIFKINNPTKQDYNQYHNDWHRCLYLCGAPGEWIIVHKSKVSLPDYIKGMAKGTLERPDAMLKRIDSPSWNDVYVREVRLCRILTTPWGVINGYCFVDDPDSKIIDPHEYLLD